MTEKNSKLNDTYGLGGDISCESIESFNRRYYLYNTYIETRKNGENREIECEKFSDEYSKAYEKISDLCTGDFCMMADWENSMENMRDC